MVVAVVSIYMSNTSNQASQIDQLIEDFNRYSRLSVKHVSRYRITMVLGNMTVICINPNK